MKICLISHAFPPEKLGGAEIYVQRIAVALARKGHKVSVITQAPYSGLSSLLPKTAFRDGFTLYRFYPLNIFSIYTAHNKPLLLKFLWRIIDLLNPIAPILIMSIILREKPDLVHTHITHGFSPFILLRALKLLKAPVVQTLHSYGLFCLRCDLLRHSGNLCKYPPLACLIFAKLSAKIVDSIPNVVIAPSRFCLRQHLDAGFFKRAKKIVLHNGVDLPMLAKKEASDKLSLVFAGRLSKNKGVQILIKAFMQLNTPAQLIIAGEGPYEKTLKRLAADDARIHFVGKLAAQELQKTFANASATVVPSIYYEPFGNVIIESFAQATPVIASRTGGIPELISDGFNGYLFEPGDILGLKQLLERIILDPRQLETLSRNAFLSSRRYGMDSHIEELEKIYTSTKNVYPRS